MSRIHEALKKAEGERAATQSGEPILSHPVEASTGHDGVTIKVEADASPLHIDPKPKDHLDFMNILEGCQRPVWKTNPNLDVISNPSATPQATEQFQKLRSRLYQLRANQTLSTVLITSSLAKEGKTFVTANLAQVLVRQPNRRVLMIDADLRRSNLHTMFGAPLSPGLSEYLSGEADETDVIQNGQGNLFLIAGGVVPTHPSELLANGRLKSLLKRVSPAFDWILIDTPPCLPVADANIVADYCDGLLLVVRAGVTPGNLVQRAPKELRGRNIVGAILNSVESALGYDSYYSAGHYESIQSPPSSKKLSKVNHVSET